MVKKVKKKEHKPPAGKTAARETTPSTKKEKQTTARSIRKTVKKVLPSATDAFNPVVKINGTWLSKTDLEYFRGLLIDKLGEITGDVGQIESGALKSSRLDASGDLSSMPIHMADIGSDNYEQEFALGLMDGERRIVQEILAALKRVQNGTYGMCEGTGNPIPRVRLEGIPWARYCVEYAQLLEKGLSGEGATSSGDASSGKEDEAEYGEGEDEHGTARSEDLDELDVPDDDVYKSDQDDEL